MSLNEKEFHVAVDHLEYEVSSLCDYWCHLRQMGPKSDLIMANALYEGMLIHGRLLIEFLIGRSRRHPGDLRPSDFGVPDDFATRRREAERLSDNLSLLDQYLAHLSKERTKDIAGVVWSYAVFKDDLVNLLLDFVECLPESRRGIAERLKPAMHFGCTRC